METKIYSPFDNLHFNYDKCFMCGSEADSQEHVFPKWLQKKYDLWNRRIQFTNGTSIQYKDLKIPCCKNCNNKSLSQLENKIKEAVDGGYERFRKLDVLTILQWVTKIYYGKLFKKLNLLYDRRNKQKGTMIKEEQIFSYRGLHEFLQSLNNPIKFSGDLPWSIQIFQVHKDRELESFDYIDTIFITGCLRFGDIGIVYSFGDWGYAKSGNSKIISDFKDLIIHPIQLQEIAARFTYARSQVTYENDSLFSMGEKVTIIGLKPNIQLKFDHRQYFEFINYFFIAYKNMVQIVYDEKRDAVTTFLYENNRVKVLDENGQLLCFKES